MGKRKKKWTTILSLLLCALLVAPAGSVAAEEMQEQEETEAWQNQFDTTSWRNTPWQVSENCESGGAHVFYMDEEDHHLVIPGPFGAMIRAGQYEYTFEASDEHGAGTVTLGCCKNCKTWVVVKTDVKTCGETGHQWSETITEEADCSKEGRTYRQCTVCGVLSEVEVLPKKEHTPGDWEVISEGKCSPEGESVLGEEVQKCTVCGLVIGERYTQPVHDFGEWKTTKEPALGVAGEKERVCKVCGYREKETIPALEEIPEHDHIFAADPSHCGWDKCTVCGVTRQNDKNHVVTEWIPNGPLTADGEHLGVCTVCGATVTEAHVYEDDGDCTTDVKCPVCGLVLTEGNPEHNKYPLFDEDEHPYYDYVDNGNGTHTRLCSNSGCTKPTGVTGVHEFNEDGICMICGAETELDDEQGCAGNRHQWSEKKTSEATCMEEGKVYQECEVCGIRKVLEVIPVKEHTPGGWELVREAACDPVEGEILGKEIQKCTACGLIMEERYSQPAHDFGEWKTTLEPKVGAAGEKERECRICGHKERKTIPALEVPPVHEHVYETDADLCGTHECTICGETVTKEHVYEDDGDCTTAVVCLVCGQTLKSGSAEHNKYPLFDEQGKPYYRGVDNGDGTHTRLCSNSGCTKPTGVTEAHKYGANGLCTVCGAGQNSPVNVKLPEGTDPTLTLNVRNVTVTDNAVKETVTARYADYVAYDITLSQENGAIVQPDGTVSISIGLPEGWENVEVYHVDGDRMEKMPTTVENGYAVFTTTHFSVYVLVKNESAVDDSDDSDESSESQPAEVLNILAQAAGAQSPAVLSAIHSPKTDDNGIGMIMACIVLFLAVGIGTCVTFEKKSKSAR